MLRTFSFQSRPVISWKEPLSFIFFTQFQDIYEVTITTLLIYLMLFMSEWL